MSILSNTVASSSQTESIFVPISNTGTYRGEAPETQIEAESFTGSTASDGREHSSSETEPASQVSLPPKPKDTRYRTLDAVRGIACLMLLLYHTTFYSEHTWSTGDPSTWSIPGLAMNLLGRMWIGVPIFFVVSGYCIASSVDSLRRKPYSISNYFYRRFRRIYPPLWAALVLVVGFTLLVGLNPFLSDGCLQLPTLSTFNTVDWIANVTATASWMPPIAGSSRDYLLKNTWTLCYEEQFYVVTGLLLLFASRYFFQACYWIAIGIVVMRPICRSLGFGIEGFFFDGHWLLFVAGILLYEKVNYMKGRQAQVALFAMLMGVVYGLEEYVLAGNSKDRHLGEYIVVASGFAILLATIKRWDHHLVSHWCLRPFLWLGTISYSLYLVHFPLTVWISSMMAKLGWHSDSSVLLGTAPLCLLASLPVAWVFHLLIERRFTNSVQR